MANQPINNRKDYEKFYSQELKSFLFNAEREAFDIPVSEIDSLVFVLVGLREKNSMLFRTINMQIDGGRISDIYDVLYDKIDKSINILKPGRKIPLSNELVMFIKKANNERSLLEHDLITSDHVLLAILSEENDIAEEFGKYGITYGTLMSLIKDMHGITSTLNELDNFEPKIITMSINPFDSNDSGDIFDLANKIQEQLNNAVFPIENLIPESNNKKSEKNTKNGIEYCTDLSELVKKGKIDNITGRDEEISELIKILNRRKSNNAIIVGDPGVGKTAIVEGLALKIYNEEVPSVMMNKKIWKLNLSSMVAGTQFRGMFEDRMSKLIKKLKSTPNNILFIDDIQSVFTNNRNSDYDIMGMLNDILSDGDVQVIAVTNHKGYRSAFEGNNTFASKFQKLVIDKPKKEDCFNILNHIKGGYEKHHHVIYSDKILNLCIELADKYITDKTLPTSAIDILDEIGSYCFLRDSFSVKNDELKKIKTDIRKNIEKALKKDDIKEVEKLENEISEIDKGIAKENGKTLSILKDNITITESDVFEVISKKTGIPINKITKSEKDSLKNIEDILKKSIIGQDDAITKICKSIKRRKVGLGKTNRPNSFLLVGKSGCGKTLLAKKIAEEIYGDEKYLVRFDMSEYSDKTAVNKLIGSSAGYVGYEEGGLLTEAIKKRKYAVLLIDEIEKANDEIFNLFLQVLDEGYLSDNTGKKIDFRNTIIILTSNVGTKRASNERYMGFSDEENDKYLTIIEKELKNKFPPEFINRLDDIIYFNTLTDDNLKDIIRLELNKMVSRLEKMNYNIKYDNTIVDYLFEIVVKEKDYGARPILRAIQSEIENIIVDSIIDDIDVNNTTIVYSGNMIKFSETIGVY